MKKPVLISGVQPTGKLHIGNYLGAIKNFVELQNSGKYQCYFFIADLHSLTEDFNPKEKPKQILDLAADFLASGLNPKKSTIFVQSQISAHSELAWILNTITPKRELERMTQFKEKSGIIEELEKIKNEVERLAKDERFINQAKKDIKEMEVPVRLSWLITSRLRNYAEKMYGKGLNDINVGLLDYPVLMAADILLYKPEAVPVGDDQVQHLEFTRTLARKFNSRFGKTFIEPRAILTEVPRLMSLDNPTKKMSKSQPAGCLFMDDSPEIMRQKIKSAVTDSGKDVKYDEKNKPAVSNLMLIYHVLSGKSLKDIEKKYKGKGYADFKKDLAEVVINYFKSFQKKKKELSKNYSNILKNIRIGNKKADAVASKKLLEVKKKIGLL